MSHRDQPTQAVLSAAVFAADKHAKQRRKGAAAEPYINHLLEVAQLVADAVREPDTNLLIAALLHDTIEDVGVTGEELAQRFGNDVATLVLEVTDDKTLPKEERKRLQIEHASKISARAQTIKLADKISNLRSILSSPPTDWSFERRKEYFTWARQVVEGFSAPNPVLKEEFENTIQSFDRLISASSILTLSSSDLTDVANDRFRGIPLQADSDPIKNRCCPKPEVLTFIHLMTLLQSRRP